MEFDKKVLVKGIEKKHSAKGKDYSMMILEDDNGRTIDFYHDGVISLEANKIHHLVFDYKISYGKPQMIVVGIK